MNSGIWIYIVPLAVNLCVAVVAKALKWLTYSGAASALVVGFLAYRFTGLGGWVLLMLFFITANILT